MIEFMIAEEMVVPRPGWKKVLDVYPERWTRIQVKAATRRYPYDAAVALRDAGWEVTEPYNAA